MNAPTVQEVQQAPQLLITLTPTGVSVTGPLSHKVLCYGMLMAAYEVVSKLDTTKVAPEPTLLLGKFS